MMIQVSTHKRIRKGECMDLSIEMLELIFNATEGKGIAILGDENVFYKTFSDSNIQIDSDGINRYVLSTEEDGIMSYFSIERSYGDREMSILKFEIEEDLDKFEFISMVISLILKHNSIVRLKNISIKKRAEIEKAFSDIDVCADEEDNEWI